MLAKCHGTPVAVVIVISRFIVCLRCDSTASIAIRRYRNQAFSPDAAANDEQAAATAGFSGADLMGIVKRAVQAR